MDWKSVNLLIENFIPGVILLVEILCLGYWAQVSPFIASNNTNANNAIVATIFFAASYGVGVLSSVVSRWLIDSLSERGPRALVFSMQTHWKAEDLEKLMKDDSHFKADMAREKQHRFRSKRVMLWNVVYRGVLRVVNKSPNEKVSEKSKESVSRRREQGRLVRNMVFPFVLAVAYTAKAIWHMVDWQVILIGLISLVLGVFLYAYAELNNFAEAADISFPDQ